MNWKVGDKAICITPGSRMEGLEVVITRGLQYRESITSGLYAHRYGVDPGFPPDPLVGTFAARPENLIPVPDNYDGLELSKWDECPWQPEKVTVCP